MLLMIDNYDSFTFNLVHYFQALGQEVETVRNDKISLDEITRLNPEYIVISPGPGRPEDAGISVSCIQFFAGKIPLLGVCLGHQAIAYAFGGSIINSKKIMHGKTSMIYHDNKGVFCNMANPLKVMRYHSLVINQHSLSNDFEITASTKEGAEIMGIRHRTLAIEGVQFHPESVLTEHGMMMLRNFLQKML